MSEMRPSFVLFSEACRNDESVCWHFVLRRPDGTRELTAEDREPQTDSTDRLALLAVVRGLEALDQPSDVTLLTTSRYVGRGLRYGMPQWRESNWMWEHFGEMVPIRNDDLWRRIDRAMGFHRVRCRLVRADRPHSSPRAPHFAKRASQSKAG